MTKGYIRYRSSYKYQLASAYQIHTTIVPNQPIETNFIDLRLSGRLTVKIGYAWDGPSGPVVDTKQNLRASLVHDALYQLMRHELLSARRHRKAADRLFRQLCKEDGVSSVKANLFYNALRRYGKPATSPMNKKKIHRAPG